MSINKFNSVALSLAIAASVGLASCCCSKSATNTSNTINTATWKLTTMNGTTDKAYADGESFTIQFSNVKNTIAGLAACNRYFGSYTLLKDKGTIKINTGGSTMMACPTMNLEQPFFLMLENATKYSINGDNLDLYNGENKIATFTAVKYDMHNAGNSLNIIGEYKGTIPAADCPGINTTITLNKDNSYSLKMEYIDRNTKVTEKGKYKVSGNILTLVSNEGKEESYKIAESKLIILDVDGNIIEGELADSYILTKK